MSVTGRVPFSILPMELADRDTPMVARRALTSSCVALGRSESLASRSLSAPHMSFRKAGKRNLCASAYSPKDPPDEKQMEKSLVLLEGWLQSLKNALR